ncbi:CLUMA_CG003326, isoform A [Clunio marinus]|uniref:CLUMA_CG003326, isoform A n=1 Tax=Clunio marinus TaxID=568069 RepID=A0A1J1HND0_9DIPT|nr:CLUMA_CG003326, isoform A [Clunio marinus]
MKADKKRNYTTERNKQHYLRSFYIQKDHNKAKTANSFYQDLFMQTEATKNTSRRCLGKIHISDFVHESHIWSLSAFLIHMISSVSQHVSNQRYVVTRTYSHHHGISNKHVFHDK